MKKGKRYTAVYSDGQVFRVYAFNYNQALKLAKDWAVNMNLGLRSLFLSRP